ncbi:MAG: hypothetical protein LBU17_09350 [Treponema sp.]|jgi:hypothetical protein|nr:hypothetical protein [Treponema sp.]
MAEEAFLPVSRDEREWVRLMSEYKFAVDLQDKMITAREEGREEERNLILDLMRQGYSADEIERRLAGSASEAPAFSS